MAANALAKFRRKVKEIQRKTGKSFRAAQKQASRENKTVTKKRHRVSGVKKKTAHPKRHKTVKHGLLGGMGSIRTLKSHSTKVLDEELGKVMVKMHKATRAQDRKKLAKKKSELVKKINILSKL